MVIRLKQEMSEHPQKARQVCKCKRETEQNHAKAYKTFGLPWGVLRSYEMWCLQGGLDQWTLGRLPGHERLTDENMVIPKATDGWRLAELVWRVKPLGHLQRCLRTKGLKMKKHCLVLLKRTNGGEAMPNNALTVEALELVPQVVLSV